MQANQLSKPWKLYLTEEFVENYVTVSPRVWQIAKKKIVLVVWLASKAYIYTKKS